MALRTVPVDAGDPPLVRLGNRILAMDQDRRREFLRTRTKGERQVCEYALGAVGVGWRADPAVFVNHLDARQMILRRHMRFLAGAFRRAAMGVEPRQAWFLPARYGKTTLASRAGPAWALDMDPAASLILTSFADALAQENGGWVRDFLTEHREHTQVRLRPGYQRAGRFQTTAGGGLLAAGAGGTITGFGAGGGTVGAGGGIIIDDLIKNWQEAHSQTTRDAGFNFYRSVLRLRLNDERAFIIAAGTRWHEDEPIARILAASEAGDEQDWQVYRLAAVAEGPDPKGDLAYLRQPDPMGRQPGELLAPDLFDAAAVAARHRALGPYLTAGMEQGRPAPEEGGEIKRGWWRWGTVPDSRPDDALTSWDMKMKDKTGGDFVVGTVWLRWAGTAWCVEMFRGQWDMNTTKTAIALAAVRHPLIHRHVVENTGNGPEVIAALRRPTTATVEDETAGVLGMTRDERQQVEALLARGMSGLVPETPHGDKTARARATSGFIAAGDVWLPSTAEFGWGLTMVNEHAAFPRGHDDIVDSTSQALRILLGVGEASMVTPDRQNRIALPGPNQVRLPTYRR